MAHTCMCTNQCKRCGACCQVCKGQCQNWVPSVPPQGFPPPNQIPVGEVRIIPQYPVTEEGLRKIVREALDEALEEIRKLKGGDDG